ncbi:MAG: ABC transporter ATP-binding protein/permease [Lachnospiraceae bacterium]|nr:ABC transporter ATP-binding protein/permease [Lachnospiraceae bacterium]MCM1238199.1 ABC transporter ATP-binding protein/permease [Lachnospiraceae bacterium]
MNERGRRFRFSIALGCLTGLVGALAAIGETWYLGQIAGVLGDQENGIWGYLLIVLVMVVLEYLSDTLGIRIKQMTRRRIVMDLRRQLFEKSVRMDYLCLKKRDSGELNSLYLSDVDIIGQYDKTLMDSFGQIAGGVAALLVCILINWKFLLVNLFFFSIMLLIGEAANRNLKKYAAAVQQKRGASAAALLDVIRNEDMAKSYSAQEYMIRYFTKAAEAENRAVLKEARKKGLAGGINRISGNLPYLAVFAVGGLLIFGGEIALGEFIAFIYIFSNVQSLQNILELRMAKKGCEAARERLDAFLAQPEEECGRKVFADFPEAGEGLHLCDLSFSYENGPAIFRDVNLHVEKGVSAGFAGESGSGKSTLLGLLTGLYAPEKGTVRYCSDGFCYEGSACRDKMAVVFQDNYVFPTTVRENLLMGKQDATQEELLQACREAGILEEIEKMPKGLDTGMSELGHSLSGGQRQRLCIARALVRKPEILIMDEPSASLDTVHEERLMEQLADVMRKGILIVVSHRQSTIGKLQRVYSLENGVLSEEA